MITGYSKEVEKIINKILISSKLEIIKINEQEKQILGAFCFGALNGYLMTGVRIPFAMAQDKLFPFPKFFGKVNDKFQTPLNSFIFEIILACFYVLSGSFDTLTNLAVFVMWIFFIMTVAGIFILRSKHKHLERPYKVPLYPIVPLIGIIGGAYILVSTLITDTSSSIYGIVITLIGLPVYYYIKKKSK
jgi:APA family basic amino acid/polyamine antiporter